MKRTATKLNLLGAIMLVMPICMVKLLASCLGVRGPDAAVASNATQHPGAGATGTVAPVVSEAHRLAADHATTLRLTPLNGNPLLYRQPPDTAEPDRVTKYALQMIMTFASGSVALIDNEQYRVGDRLARSDWIVIGIDRHARVVTLRNRVTGREDRLAVETFR